MSEGEKDRARRVILRRLMILVFTAFLKSCNGRDDGQSRTVFVGEDPAGVMK